MASTSQREREIAIVGVAESDLMGNVPDKSSLQHHAEAAHNALADAGLQLSDVNGLMTAGFSTLATAEYIGLQPSFTDNTSVGGSSFVIHVAHAAAAIRAGYCDTVLITHGQAGRSTRVPVPPDRNLPVAQYEIPYGMIGQPINYAMGATRYMHEYGEDRTRQALAEIAVSTRKWGEPESGGIHARFAHVVRRLPQFTMGGMAVPPVRLLPSYRFRGGDNRYHRREGAELQKRAGVGVGSRRRSRPQPDQLFMPNHTSTWARETGPLSLQRAGLTHDDIDLTMIYDSFTYTTLVTIEGLGSAGRARARISLPTSGLRLAATLR